MTEHDSASTATEPRKGSAAVYSFFIIITLIAALALAIDAVSDEKAEYPGQLDPTTLDDAP